LINGKPLLFGMDWKIVIADIQRHGKLTQPQIAEKCGCGQATVSDLAKGHTEQPRHSLGQALLALLDSVSAQDSSKALANTAQAATENVAQGV